MYATHDIAELRRLANANLRKIADGTHKREAERAKLAEAQRKEFERQLKSDEREETRQEKAKLKQLKSQLKELENDWGWLYKLDDLSGTKADMGVADHVVLDEIDGQITTLQEKIFRLENKLAGIPSMRW